MNIEKLTDYWIKYKDYFELPEPENDEKYKWTVLAQVFEKWDWNATNKLEMFKNAFEVKGSKNLWLSGQYFPISHTIWMFEVFPKETIEAFDYLFNESIPILDRVQKFIGLYDEKLPYLKELAPDKKINYHSHGDMRATALYLFLQNPNKYYLFKYTMVKDFLLNIGEQSIKMGNFENLELYFNNSNIVLEFIKSDIEFLSKYNEFLREPNKYKDESLHLLTQDFIYFISKSNKSKYKKYWRIGTDDNDGNEFWELMKSENKICIGWSGIGDLDLFKPKNKESIIQAFNNEGSYKEDNKQSVKSRKAGEILNFYRNISEGDIVLAQRGYNILGIGRVTNEYYYNNEDDFAHQKEVEWLGFNPSFKNQQGNRTTVYEITEKSIINNIEKFIQDSKEKIMNNQKNIFEEYTKYLSISNYAEYTKQVYAGDAKEYIMAEWRRMFKNDFDPLGIDSKKVYNIKLVCGDVFKSGFKGKHYFLKFLNEYFQANINYGLNTIMYGAPGTGKTFNTKKIAVEIITGIKFSDSEIDRKEILKYYNDLITKGYIQFTTFHQSMSYEEFVEGIKPENSNGKVVYEIKDGIFKSICIEAQTRKSNSFEEAYLGLLEELNHIDLLDLKTPNGNIFSISINRNNNLSLHTGEDRGKQGTLTKENILKQISGDKKFVGWEGYFEGVVNYLKSQYGFDGRLASDFGKYVLIIDEINRGNVSAIFGELITLIEEDKRKGGNEEIIVKLPYSNSNFSVPSNVHIVGTMNTADRSVEALDTALRRRFSFIEMPSRPELLESIFEGNSEIDLYSILETINKRIEILIDKDHQIGHAYFMSIKSIKDLKLVFKDKIIPLLEEYFFGDIGKICLVLGDNFMELVYSNTNDLKNALAKSKVYKEIDFVLDKQVYKVKDIDCLEAKDFITIYQDTNIEEE